MAAVSFDTLAMLESASDPQGEVFRQCLQDLYDVSDSVQAMQSVQGRDKKTWNRIFPFCGSAVENRRLAELYNDFVIADHPTFTQGVASLAHLFYHLVSLFKKASAASVGRTLVVSSYAREICDMFTNSDPEVITVDYTTLTNYETVLLPGKYTVVIFDHTTVTARLDTLLTKAHAAGVKVVEGLFYFSPAIDNGWSGVHGDERILIDHTIDGLNVGPVDDPTRVLYYPRHAYKMFTSPRLWSGPAKNFYYELKSYGLLSNYTATNIGMQTFDNVVFKVPVCSSPDKVLIVVNREFATGLFSTSTSSSGVSLFNGNRDYAIEPRRKLFDDAIMYLVGRQKGTDLVTEAIKYISAHNYSDLFENSRVISADPLSYTDGLCVAVVCAIQAYVYRYQLTNDSIRSIVNAKSQAYASVTTGASGVLGKISYLLTAWTKRVLYDVPVDILTSVKTALATTDLIPGVFYDVYRDRQYVVGAKWYESGVRRFFDHSYDNDMRDDPITAYLGGVHNASAADYLLDEEAEAFVGHKDVPSDPYQFQPVAEPIKKFQDVYDHTFPGNSVAGLANVAELRKTRDVDISMDFVGKIQIGMDSVRPEVIHQDMPLRTAALPVGRGGLVDSIMASAKRNFSVPDMHDVVDVWSFGRKLVDEFIRKACVPGAREVCAGYRKNPIVVNVTAYNDWAAGKSEQYMAALLGDIPDELVELGLSKYTSILKGRVKPKLSVTAQRELGQPQVVVHHTKRETAVYSGVFRKAFERFDSILKDEYKSAGRISDTQMSEWATRYKDEVLGTVLLEGDSTMYDKSQSLLAMVIEVEMLLALGMSAEVVDSLKKSFVGTVNSRAAGLSFILAMQRKSGHVDTMLGNLIYNFISLGHCVGYDNIVVMIAKGDDNLAGLRPKVFEGKDAAVVAQKFGKYFNLESKIILHEVPGFSSGGFVPHAGGVRYFPDPLKLLELLGERVYGDERLDAEKFQSFRDRVSAYNHDGLPQLIQEWVHRRYRCSSDVVGLIDSFLTVASDFEMYKKLRR